MSELKLLPCPFCGGEAELMIFNSEYETVTVGCTNEDCDITMGKAFFTDEEAIEHWNRRTPMANIVEKLEELPYGRSYHDYAEKGIVHKYLERNDVLEIVKQEINNGN